MTPLPLARALALATPLMLLGGAYASQYLGGLHPCEMCWWQRYPHMAAIPLALMAYATARNKAMSRLLTGLAALAVATSGVIGLFHAGVEYGWWEGLTACSTAMGAGDAANMLDAIMAAPLARCDVAPWSLLGISLAGYNGLLSMGAASAILMLLAKSRKTA
ncbi:disulfide bond formation protein B [Sphingobium sp. AN641]|uniref:disulfide bond formation protein B n=1 Tax=Sphingobium sp. AN641 TaxID=3133443 RepID=UPI0030C523B6